MVEGSVEYVGTLGRGYLGLYLNGVSAAAPVACTRTPTPGYALHVGRKANTAGNYLSGTVQDAAVWYRECNVGEIQLLASHDPMYGGWLQHVTRRTWFVPTAAPTGNRRRRVICGACP